MKKLINFIILVASILWFVVLFVLQLNTMFNANITPEYSSFFQFYKTYGATIILGSYVFFNTIGRGVIRLLFGFAILVLLVAVTIMLINPGLISGMFFPAA